MTDWARAQLQVYNDSGAELYRSEDIIEAQGNRIWHEIGRGASVTVPFSYTNADFIFERGRRVIVTIANSRLLLTHVIADFIIESTAIEETSLQDGGSVTVIKVTGRDVIKELGSIPAGLRHISKTRIGRPPTAVGKTTLQMDAIDTAEYAANSLIGWTVELADGNWSEITGHTAGGLLTIDPAWQVNVDDDAAPAPPPQKFYLYGAAFTETAGLYTDVKLALQNVLYMRDGWGVYGYQSTTNGSFVAPGKEASILQALQMIAAQSGEYFVRSFEGGKSIQWRREVPSVTHPQYGNPLNLVVKSDYNPMSEAVILPGAKLNYDANEMVTRVKPTGSGSGDKGVSLKDLPSGFPVAAGYTLDGEYLVYTAGENGSRYAARDLRLDGIGPASDSAASRQLAAQALYNAALLWLREHYDERLNFECEVLSAIPIEPVTYVYVTNLDYALNRRLMYVLDVTATYRDSQLLYKLQLSDKKSPIMTDERLLAEAIRQTDVQLFYTNAPARNSRSLDRSNFSGGGGNDHEPVTAGNAAVGVATGQVISLVLAGPSGLEIASTGLRVADTFAGAGLSISNKVIGLNLLGNSGLLISGNAVGLGTPGTLDTTTSSQVVGSGHFHAITSYTNAKTNPAHLIKSDAFGDVTLRFLTADKVISPELEAPGSITLDPGTSLIYADGNLSFVGARQIVTDSGSLTLAPAQTLIIDPADNVAQIHTDVTLRTAHAAVGVFPQTGWQVNYGGAGYFTSLMADELHVQSFIADIMRVKVGGEYIPESMALISRNLTIPAVGGSATLYVEDVPGWNNIAAFADGDWVLLRVVDRSGGGLVVANAYGQVTNYTDLNGGEQSWTFTCRVATTAVGRVARRGDLALDFGKSGSSWWYVTVLDKTGPHAGFGTWRGNNPTEGVSYPIRLGQLHGVSGVNELGFQTGSGLSSRTRFTNLRNEIHGSRFSLYAGDGAQLRVCAASVLFYLNSITYQTLTPNADHSSLNVVSSGASFYQTIDESTSAPVMTDYIANGANTAGYAMLGLGDPTGFSSVYQVRLSYVLAGVGFVNDTVRLYAQVFQSDELTPLTGEVLVRAQSSNVSSSSSSITLPHHDPAATAAEWSGARLRLRWEYDINANEEAIRLDPQVPSIAVGNPLPTGLDTGGDGLWVGASGGAYKLRLGRASGVGLRWDDTALSIRNSANQPIIVLNNTGVSEFAGPMTLGAAGGIWQGSGTFASPVSGFKLSNSGGKGKIEMFPATGSPVVLDENGLSIPTRQTSGSALKNVNEISFLHRYLGTDYKAGGMTGYGEYGASFGRSATQLYVTNKAGTSTRSYIEVFHYEEGASNTDTIELNTPGQISLNGARVIAQGPVEAYYTLRTAAGIVVGQYHDNAGTGTPPNAVIRFVERAGISTVPAGYADMYVSVVGGVPGLYIRFAGQSAQKII